MLDTEDIRAFLLFAHPRPWKNVTRTETESAPAVIGDYVWTGRVNL